MGDSAKSFAEQRLSAITRDSELIHSFLRVNPNALEKPEEEPLIFITTEDSHQTKKEEEIGEFQEPISAETTKKLSEQLTQEAKKKRKKRRKNGQRDEEIYCDKDRAAAVNLGSKDIKQSLRLKRKQDRSKYLQIPEEAEPGTFLALGNYEMCRGDLQIAIDFISKALELNPVEKNALVARSKCYILLGQPDNALKDAETALYVDRHFMKAIYQKAEALYYLGDFEHSLMFFHRGLHIRPDHEKFKLGVHKAQKAIENAIGSSFSDLIRSRAASISNVSEKSMGSVESVSEATTKKSEHISPTPKSGTRATPQGTNKSLKKSRLLRELAPDKDYLDNLMNNPNIKCKYKGNDTTVEKYIKETVEYLNARQEFWRQQLPANLK